MSNSTLTLLENIREGNTLNLFYEVSIALITKTEKNIIGKKNNYRPTFSMNTDMKIYSKVLANESHQDNK